MIAHLYRLRCLTNLHVGSGDVNYNIIDNEVEKDPVLEAPIIHATGVKGALRAHFERLWQGKPEFEKIAKVFGSPVRASKSNLDSTRPGSYCFLDAPLLTRPLRVSEFADKGPSFVSATSIEIINAAVTLLQGLGIREIGGQSLEQIALPDPKTLPKKGFWKLNKGVAAAKAEGLSVQSVPANAGSAFLNSLPGLLRAPLGTDQAVITENSILWDIALPVLAHNHLEDGESKNLFYEEVVPHHSVFLLPVLTPEQENVLESGLLSTAVQFGSGASLGYGLTRIEKVV